MTVTEHEKKKFKRLEVIRELEASLFDEEIPRLHEMQRTLHYGHIAITEQASLVNLLQDKVSKAEAW
jgi:hypothetical protein